MKKIRDPGSPRVEGFWPWESLLSRILSGSRLEPWLEPLTLPAGAPWIFLIFLRKGQKTKKIKKNQKNEKNPGPWVSPRGGFLAVGIPPLPDPEWLQAGALAGALDSPGGGTLDFVDFFHFFDIFDFFSFFGLFEKNQKNQKIFIDFFRLLAFSKKIKKINKFLLIFLIFFEKAKKRKK